MRIGGSAQLVLACVSCLALLISESADAAKKATPTSRPTEPYEGTADFFLCNNLCFAARDGVCDDGGPGSKTGLCPYGYDCEDCTGGVPRPPYTRGPTTFKPVTGSPTIWRPPEEPASRTQAPVKSDGYQQVTPKPTPRPTNQPTLKPTKSPTLVPTRKPTKKPTPKPTKKNAKAKKKKKKNAAKKKKANKRNLRGVEEEIEDDDEYDEEDVDIGDDDDSEDEGIDTNKIEEADK